MAKRKRNLSLPAKRALSFSPPLSLSATCFEKTILIVISYDEGKDERREGEKEQMANERARVVGRQRGWCYTGSSPRCSFHSLSPPLRSPPTPTPSLLLSQRERKSCVSRSEPSRRASRCDWLPVHCGERERETGSRPTPTLHG